MSKIKIQQTLHSHDSPSQDELLEVLDEKSRPFIIMPRSTVLEQGLRYHTVLVLVRNRDRQIYIHKRSALKKSYPGLWNVSVAGLVQAGEALEDAALRELSEELGVSGLPLSHATSISPSSDTDWAHVSLFLSNPANLLLNPNPDEISEGMFVDEDELTALIRDMPEMLTPALKWAAQATDIFNY